MPNASYERPRGWLHKFQHAFRGMVFGMHGHSSFAIHLPCAVLVVVIAGWLQVSRFEWCILLLCIFGVLTAELFNSALESVAKATDTQHNPHLGAALDIASAAVLTSALGAALVAMLILGPHLWAYLRLIF